MPAFGKAATAALAAGSLWERSADWVSDWGTEKQSSLPTYLTNNPLPQGKPWGTKTANNTNYYEETPNTGVTRHYDWTIAKVPCAPDGFDNTCLLINNQFPGPLIEANWGDWFEITVHNTVEDEGTSIHWHGLLQKDTPYMDGVPGNNQCPIAPGSSFTYRFRADLYGTSWYHSHWSAQYGSGLFGPIVIHGPENAKYDDDLGPVMVSDYFHEYYIAAVEKTLAPLDQAGPPLADNNLINGKASNGGPGKATFSFTSGKTIRIRVINTSAASVQRVSIDGYTFTVIQTDFVPVEPYETDILTLSVGQRYDVLVKANGKSTDAVWMRSFRPPPCGPTNGGEEVLAAIYYEDADRSKDPTTQPNADAHALICGNDPPLSTTVPYYPMTPPEPDVTEDLQIVFKPNGTAILWYLNGRTFRINYNDPMLLEAKLGNTNYPEIENAHIYDGNIKSIRMVIENPGNQPHPMHLHGHNIWVLQEGPCTAPAGSSAAPAPAPSATGNGTKRDLGIDYGTNQKRQAPAGSCWDGSIVNPENPTRRDVHMLLPFQYIVIQWLQDNPGVWPLHCHIAWHLSAGFNYMVVENPEAIQQEMEIPSIMAQTCRDWATYSNQNVVQQIDDGI